MRPTYFTTKKSSLLDSLAIALSGLCLVHCLALPVLIALFPLLSVNLVDHESFHQIILVAVVPTTAIALVSGIMRHHRMLVAVLGIIGVAALTFAAFVLHAVHAHGMETWVTVTGGLLLASAHVLNFRHCKHRGCTPKPLTQSEQA